MAVYASLYRQRTGEYPDRVVLYFLNELKGDPPPTERPVTALYSVDFDDEQIHQGLEEFDETVEQILRHKEQQNWPAPGGDGDSAVESIPNEETCDVCDIRFDCPAREGAYPLRYPVD